MLDDDQTQDNDFVPDAIGAALHPPFALLLNDVPIAKVCADDMIDACAEIMCNCKSPQRPCSVTAVRLPNDEMSALPWFSSAGSVVSEEDHVGSAAEITSESRATVPESASAAPPTAPDDLAKPARQPRRPQVVVVEHGTPIGARSFKVWPDHVRCVPSCLLRCAIFTPIGSAGRKHRKPVPLVAPTGLKVSIQGAQPLQSDLDVFLGVLHVSRREVEGSLIRVSMADLIAACGRTDGNKTREHLVRASRRLQSVRVSIDDTAYFTRYQGPLLEDLSIVRGKLRTVTVRVPAAFYELFLGNKTYLDLDDRRNCAGRPIAGWLQAFLATHRHPFPYSKALYRRLTGLRCTQFAFNRMLGKGLDRLKAIGFLIDYEIDAAGNIKVTRRPAPSKRKPSAT